MQRGRAHVGDIHLHRPRSFRGRFSSNEARFYAAEIVDALEYIHGQGIVHRDIRPENILVMADGHIKIIDFGSGKMLRPMPDGIIVQIEDTRPEGALLGTAEYISPEVLNRYTVINGADLWALGCIIFEMLEGKRAFQAKDDDHLYQQVTSRQFRIPSHFSPEAKDLVDSLLDLVPERRPGAGPRGYAALKDHPFFSGVAWDKVREVKPPAVVTTPVIRVDESLEVHYPPLKATAEVLTKSPSVEDGGLSWRPSAVSRAMETTRIQQRQQEYIRDQRIQQRQQEYIKDQRASRLRLREEEMEDAQLCQEGLESAGNTDGEQELGQGEEQGDLDPLALVEEDAQGKLLYEQFERLEYEALAAKEAATRGGELTPEVNKKLGDADELYATGKFDEAIKLLSEVVKLEPYVPDTYHILALVHEAMGNRKKSLSFYMLAAAVTPKDPDLWKRLASMSMEQGNIPQAIWCLSRAIKADPRDEDAKWDRAALYVDLGDFKKAAGAFEEILVSRPSDVEVRKMVSKMQHKIGNVERATQVLENLLEEHPC